AADAGGGGAQPERLAGTRAPAPGAGAALPPGALDPLAARLLRLTRVRAVGPAGRIARRSGSDEALHQPEDALRRPLAHRPRAEPLRERLGEREPRGNTSQSLALSFRQRQPGDQVEVDAPLRPGVRPRRAEGRDR